MAEKYLSRSAFAALQGWSPSYITKLGDQGRLKFCPDNPLLIDVAATLADLLRTGDPRKATVRLHHAAVRVAKHVTPYLRADAPDDAPQASADPKYWASKARREGALASIAEMELAGMRRDLVARQRVEAIASLAGEKLREAMLRLPPLLSPEFAAMGDAFAIEVKLRDALRRVFVEASKMTPDDLGAP